MEGEARRNIVHKGEVWALVILGVVFFALAAMSGDSRTFVSSELNFADASPSGLAIVPASCPSSPHYEGGCSILPVPFTATTPWGTNFEATGNLEVRPILVRQGEPVQVYWQAENVQGCEVVGSNGDSWSGAFSGATGTTSSDVIEQTTFTLSCSALEGIEPTSFSEDVIVNVLPEFEET